MINRLLSKLVRFYQATLSFFVGGRCRYYPSCSEYALEALQRHKPLRASKLILSRLSRCHPLSRGGADFVP